MVWDVTQCCTAATNVSLFTNRFSVLTHVFPSWYGLCLGLSISLLCVCQRPEAGKKGRNDKNTEKDVWVNKSSNMSIWCGSRKFIFITLWPSQSNMTWERVHNGLRGLQKETKLILTDFFSWFKVYHIACQFSFPDCEQFKSTIGFIRYSPS